MKNSKLMFMVVAGLSIGFVVQGSDENLPKFNGTEKFDAVKSLFVSKDAQAEVQTPVVTEATAPAATEVTVPASTDVTAPVAVASTEAPKVETPVSAAPVVAPTMFENAKTKANEFMVSASKNTKEAGAFTSKKMVETKDAMGKSMTQASDYTKANPVLVSSVSAAVVVVAGVTYYVYTQCCADQDTEVKNS